MGPRPLPQGFPLPLPFPIGYSLIGRLKYSFLRRF
jgi:hypothetical protein